MSASMTHKHFEELVAVIAELHLQFPDVQYAVLFEHLVDDLADYCRHHNDNFIRARFTEACSPQDRGIRY